MFARPLIRKPALRVGSRRPLDSTPGRGGGVGGTLHFLRHFGEMVLAMVAGMAILGMLGRAILAAAGSNAEELQDSAPEVVALVMAFNMTVGMTVWMRHRGHAWPRVAEMAGAMFVPSVAAIVLFWCAVIHSDAILALQHVAMLPAMLAVMLLHRSEYSQPVHAHSATG